MASVDSCSLDGNILDKLNKNSSCVKDLGLTTETWWRLTVRKKYTITQLIIVCILRSIKPPQNQSRPIIFCKHQCALMDYNIFMKQKGSIIFILNHSGNFFGRTFLFFVAFWSFFIPENLPLGILSRKNFLVTQIFKCLTVQKTLIGRTNKILLNKS